MSSTVVLTDEIRTIPYFSSFSPDEKEVVIPREKINESISYINVEDISTEDIVLYISNRIYLGFKQEDNDELVKELFWRLGKTEEKMKSIETLDIVVRKELQMRLTEYGAKYIYGIRCRIKQQHSMYLCKQAAWHNNLKLLKWFREQGYPWGDTLYSAIQQGNLEIVKWGYENGCSPPESFVNACSTAAYHGHLEVLKYLREKEYSWDFMTCARAAEQGHLDVLKWAVENGCSLNNETNNPFNPINIFDYAINSRRIDILEYLRSKECKFADSTYELANERSVFDYDLDGEYTDEKKIRVLKYLENECPMLL